MTNDANQIEMLVREVMARLAPRINQAVESPQGSQITSSTAITPTVAAGSSEAAVSPLPPKDELAVMASVISVDVLQGKLSGIRQVRVRSKAVVTPAARDFLKAARVALVRGEEETKSRGQDASAGNLSSPSTAVPALAVLCPKLWVERLQKSLCPRRANLDVVAAVGPEIVLQIQKKMGHGHRLSVLVTEGSFDAVIQLARVGVRAVRIGSWADFQLALADTGPQVWVLDPRQWNIPLTLNVCNRVYENGYWRQRKEAV